MIAASSGFVYRQKSGQAQPHITATIITYRKAQFARRVSAALGAMVRVTGLALGLASTRLRIRLCFLARDFLTTVHKYKKAEGGYQK